MVMKAILRMIWLVGGIAAAEMGIGGKAVLPAAEPQGLEAEEDTFSLDEERMYRAFLSEDNRVCLAYTADGGASWEETTVSGVVSGNGRAFVSFADEDTGYVLYCADPGAGQMEKVLYVTEDGGRTFSVQEDLSSVIAGYPTDLLYVPDGTGYVTVTYHGTDEYLYRFDERNGWSSVDVEIPVEDYSYVNGIGIEKDGRGLVLDLEAVTAEGSVFGVFTSPDGLNWTQKSGQ